MRRKRCTHCLELKEKLVNKSCAECKSDISIEELSEYLENNGFSKNGSSFYSALGSETCSIQIVIKEYFSDASEGSWVEHELPLKRSSLRQINLPRR